MLEGPTSSEEQGIDDLRERRQERLIMVLHINRVIGQSRSKPESHVILAPAMDAQHPIVRQCKNVFCLAQRESLLLRTENI
jgi:hypothetical protein